MKIIGRISIAAIFALSLSSPPAAASNGANTAIGVGIGALIGGLILGAMSKDQPQVTHVSLRERAEAGDVNAQIKLAANYEKGAGVKQNYAEAFKWYLRAAQKGNGPAEFKIGQMYAQGTGTMRDKDTAYFWYVKAAANGSPEAIGNIQKAAMLGEPDAEIALGNLYQFGYGIPQNGQQAVHWYRLAADQGDSRAQNALGQLYENGDGIVRNYINAYRWYNFSARQGNAHAEANLGRLYLEGKGTSIDRVAAYKWLNLAAAQGNEIAKSALSSLESSLSPKQIEDGQAKARDFSPQPPYSKQEMDWIGRYYDLKDFVINYYPFLLVTLIIFGLFFTKTSIFKRLRSGHRKTYGIFAEANKATSATAKYLFSFIKRDSEKPAPPETGKRLFQAIENRFTGPNSFRSIVTLVLCLFLLMTNPTSNDFTSYFRGWFEKHGNGDRLTAALASTIVSGIAERHDFFFFSVFGLNSPVLASINDNAEDGKFLGIAGKIIPLF